METITNVVQAASKAIYGDPTTTTQSNETGGQEPISGQQGKGTVNEPYDQGNAADINPSTQSTNTSTHETNTPIIGGKEFSFSSNDSTYLPRSEYQSTSTGPTVTESDHSTSNTSGADHHTSESAPSNPPSSMSEHHAIEPNRPVNAAQGGTIDPLKSTDKTGVSAGRTGDARKAEDIIPSERSENPGVTPSSGAAPEYKQQSADKPLDEPKGEQEGAIKGSKNEAEELLKKRDPNDHSGEPMHMHEGPEITSSARQGSWEERRESKVGHPGGQEHGSEPKGTGDEWVKTSGMAVDGGDFDATKPGAGKEADRLLEEKGVKKTDSNKGSSTATTNPEAGDSHGGKEKVSISEKIKNKLHIGSHK